mmetsp:Transcript_23651/g.54224  ORF Transcript_23651/g.54224 Transcript_23651/m.54224 type:complete len:108 (+) Transcript_23651:216-539(+)
MGPHAAFLHMIFILRQNLQVVLLAMLTQDLLAIVTITATGRRHFFAAGGVSLDMLILAVSVIKMHTQWIIIRWYVRQATSRVLLLDATSLARMDIRILASTATERWL